MYISSSLSLCVFVYLSLCCVSLSAVYISLSVGLPSPMRNQRCNLLDRVLQAAAESTPKNCTAA